MPVLPHVLLLESYPSLLYLLTRKFKKLGCTVTAARDSFEAADDFLDHPPHLIVMEPRLDEQNHWLLLETLAPTPPLDRPLLFFLTSWDAVERVMPREHLKQVTMILQKPFGIDMLIPLAERFLCLA